MKLINLNPRFVGAGGPGVTIKGQPAPERNGVGLSCDCPCGCTSRVFVYFENPVDGQPYDTGGAPTWKRVGDDFKTLTLKPSLLRSDPDGCRWHGWLTDGEFKSC